MFPLYPFNPFIPIGQRNQIKRIDVGGIYELKTNAQQVTDASVDYGINPCYYNALPCECIVLLKIHQGVAAASAALPVTIVTPIVGRPLLTEPPTLAELLPAQQRCQLLIM